MSERDPCYSPSQTTTWLECRVKRWLQYRERWQPRAVGRPEMSALGGRAFAAGIADWYQARQVGNPEPLAHAQQVAKQIIAVDLERFQRNQQPFNGQAEAMLPGLAGQVSAILAKVTALDPTAGMEVVAVEQPIPECGYVRPDIVLRDSLGLAVGDWKLKLNLKADYIPTTLEEYRNSWQFLHGAWAVGQHYKEPVKTIYLFLVIGAPRFQVIVDSQVVDAELLSWWESSARTYWQEMYAEDAGTKLPAMAAKHRTQYGVCPYYRACFDCRLDPGLMQQDYIQVQREGRRENAPVN